MRAARRLRLPALAAAALAVAAGVLLAGCGGPERVPLAELAVEMEAYDGREVRVRGVVVAFDGGEDYEAYWVLQDAGANRVQLLPGEAAAPHTGAAVEVTGTFALDPGRGRVLHVERIEPVAPG